MKNVVIVTGGNRNIDQYRDILQSISLPELVIGVDAGAAWLLEHGERIDLAVGDFDSIGELGLRALKNAKVKMLQAIPEKDETDSELAVTVALKNNAKRLTIYGGIGSRFDHSLSNIHLLWRCQRAGVAAEVIDPWNRIRIVENQVTLVKEFPFISLIPFTPVVTGVTLIGFKYPLDDATLEWGNGLGVSNEIVAESGSIELAQGALMVIESSDN